MTEQELFQAILEAEAADSELTEILEKIRNKTATFQDTQRYSFRSAEIRAKILSQHLSPAGSGQNEESCYQLLQDQHKDVNQKAAAVQKILDEKQNLHISPAIAAFPAERARKASHSLEDKTVSQEVLQRRAENAIANIANSFHDDYIKENASFRQKAGLTCHVNRIGASKCCAWCAEVAGRYEVSRAPADFWRRHDHCSCQIIYETSKFRQRLSGTGRGWKVDSEVHRRQAQAIQYKPTRFTREQAQALESQQLSQYRGLTNQAGSGTINTGKPQSASQQDIENFVSTLKAMGFSNVIGFQAYTENSVHLFEIAEDFRKLNMDFSEYFQGLVLNFGTCSDMTDNDYAAYESKNSTLYLNPFFYNNIESYSQQYESDVKQGYHPRGTTYRATVFHEFGHRVEDVAGITGKNVAKILFIKENNRYYTRKMCDEWTTKNLSQYAIQFEYGEFISESFAEYYGSISPRSLCKKVVEELMN